MVFDFLIIGGGIAGATAGAALSALGSVVLWEAEAALGTHASGRSAALFEQSYGLPSVIALNKASRDSHIAGGYTSPRGLLFVATPDQADLLAADIKTYGLAALSPEQAAAKVRILDPGAIHGAGYTPDAFDLDTDRMVQDAARTIRSAGGIVETGRPVDAIRKGAGGWEVTAPGHGVRARMLVNAAGAWADEIAQMAGVSRIGLTPLRRSMARLAAPGGHPTRDYPMMIGAGETWYAKPDAGALLVSPADEDPSPPMDAYPDDLVLAEGLARYQAVVTPEVTRPIATWAGLRTFAPDRALVLGPDPNDRSFIWCAGQGGYGFQTAPAAARLLSDLISNRTPALDPDIVSALIPDRFS